MTSEKDKDFEEFFKTDFKESEKPKKSRPEEIISLWLAGSIIFFLALIFVIAALIIHKVYFQPPTIRTAIERDLVKFKTAIKNNPRGAEAYVGLAGIYLELEQPKKAIGELNKAIELEPRSWNANFELGMAYDALDEADEAVSYFWKAAAIDTDNELAFYQIGKLYKKQELYGQAIQAFRRTLKLNPTLSDAHYYLGFCYEKTDKIELARREYREALKYVDKYPEAEKALRRLE